MKKFVVRAILLSFIVVGNIDGYAQDGVPCDANGSGTITAADVTALINDLRNRAPAEGNADCNGSGTVTAADVTALINVLRGRTEPPNGGPTPTPTPTPTPFPPCPTNPDCGSPNFDAFDDTVVTFCEDDPEDGGLLGEVIVVEDVVLLLTRIPPNLRQFAGGPGTVLLECPVIGPTACDPTQGRVVIETESGNTFNFAILKGTVFLSDNAFDNAFLNVVDVLADSPFEIEPLNSISGCVEVEGLPAAQAKDLPRILEEKMIEYGLD